jgi:hypothetical protein
VEKGKETEVLPADQYYLISHKDKDDVYDKIEQANKSGKDTTLTVLLSEETLKLVFESIYEYENDKRLMGLDYLKFSFTEEHSKKYTPISKHMMTKIQDHCRMFNVPAIIFIQGLR